MTLDRQAPCPSCGAPITFKFGGAQAQVCGYCRGVVARTDRGLEVNGKFAELLEIPSPLIVGAGGWWGQRRFEVIGRVQMDRADRTSAPWQEILISFSDDGANCWIAQAQGRWYATSEAPALEPLPRADALRPGGAVSLAGEAWVVQELASRRVVSGEGSLTRVPDPRIVTRYADISASGGRFGTIDYGDGRAAPVLFLGRQFDPAELRLDSGMPLEPAAATAKALDCPHCGASLPLLSQASERVICQYCGTASDIQQGALRALGPSPRPPIVPVLPIGAQGIVRGVSVTVCGFVLRSCADDGEPLRWTEYLLWGGASAGYSWLVDEGGEWSFVTPIETGDVADAGSSVLHRGVAYSLQHQVTATVDGVVGEFYWKVTVGESVEATEFKGPGGKISREQGEGEINYSLCLPLNRQELSAFGITPPQGKSMLDTAGEGFGGKSLSWWIWVVIAVLLFLVSECNDCDGGSSYGGGSGFGGK
ncbi:MAG: DUF4178 domain-containing protein [Myxococcales bacterium]|nr:DUF4178 domain-containing protein [Myxococcales bacterium]